ncbi:MAG: aldolase catalytic domain-containing protein [Deltaproteobacteria bacterium]|nr:aldolase catalytic domain-containing protein [Deltaproteobacteria bacterium]
MILDCTIRDGGYLTDWRFSLKVVKEVYRAVSKAGVDYVELGYHASERFYDPKKYGLWRFSPESALREVCSGVKGARIGLMVDSGGFDPADLPPSSQSLVELIRIAVHRDRLDQALREASAVKEKGYQISLQLMGYSTYPHQVRQDLKRMLEGAPLDFVYVADSYGSILPDQMEAFLEPVQSIEGIKVGFHPHNQLQMSFANALEAMRCGVDIIDGTIYGIGRAAGNLPLETFVAYLQARWPDRFSVLPLLNVIDRHFLSLKQKHPWGYQLPYMLSGLMNIHPNYAKALVERREYTIEDIWKGLKAVALKPVVGFSKDLLDDLITSGLAVNSSPVLSLSTPEEKAGASLPQRRPDYQDRHRGRDFLVLANGPSLGVYADRIRAFIEKYDPVVLGGNFLGGLFVPHYHAFTNKRRFMDYVGQVHPDSKLLLGTNFEEPFIREQTNRDFEWLVFQNRLADFDIKEGVVTANCRTVSVLLCAVVLVMGASRVFVVGMDGYTQLTGEGVVHFYDETDDSRDPEHLLEQHRQCLYYLGQVNDYAEAQGLEGIHILTPTTYAAFYKGMGNYLEGE